MFDSGESVFIVQEKRVRSATIIRSDSKMSEVALYPRGIAVLPNEEVFRFQESAEQLLAEQTQDCSSGDTKRIDPEEIERRMKRRRSG